MLKKDCHDRLVVRLPQGTSPSQMWTSFLRPAGPFLEVPGLANILLPPWIARQQHFEQPCDGAKVALFF